MDAGARVRANGIQGRRQKAQVRTPSAFCLLPCALRVIPSSAAPARALAVVFLAPAVLRVTRPRGFRAGGPATGSGDSVRLGLRLGILDVGGGRGPGAHVADLLTRHVHGAARNAVANVIVRELRWRRGRRHVVTPLRAFAGLFEAGHGLAAGEQRPPDGYGPPERSAGAGEDAQAALTIAFQLEQAFLLAGPHQLHNRAVPPLVEGWDRRAQELLDLARVHRPPRRCGGSDRTLAHELHALAERGGSACSRRPPPAVSSRRGPGPERDPRSRPRRCRPPTGLPPPASPRSAGRRHRWGRDRPLQWVLRRSGPAAPQPGRPRALGASLSSTSVLRPVCLSSTMPFSASFSAKSRKVLTP